MAIDRRVETRRRGSQDDEVVTPPEPTPPEPQLVIDPNNLPGTARLTFAEEFDTLSLWNGSSGRWGTNLWWGHENGHTVASNGDQQWYIDANYAPTSSVRPWTVSDGILSITTDRADPAIRPYIDNYEYTSGLIHSYHAFSQQYGYFEMSAQLPKGQGFWPAFWLLPATLTWPPEIDIMEVLGHDVTTLVTAAHTMETGTHTAVWQTNTVADMSIGYHTYGLDWQADYLTWYFDGREVFKAPTPADLHQPMYIVANLTVGADWPGRVDSTTPFPSSFKIDYIRAYEEAPPPPTNLTITGTATNDTLRGEAGDDTISGLGGADALFGAAGSDTLNGGTGRDKLCGGPGSDVLTGGANQDTFVFDAAFDGSIDRITDFSSTDDTIRLENEVFTTLNIGRQLVSSAYYRGAAAHDATDRIIYNPATGALTYDPDGNGPASPVQFAQLGTGLNLTSSDFNVV